MKLISFNIFRLGTRTISSVVPKSDLEIKDFTVMSDTCYPGIHVVSP